MNSDSEVNNIIWSAQRRICSKSEPHVDPSEWPAGDHGHTDCWIIGGLLEELSKYRNIDTKEPEDGDGGW